MELLRIWLNRILGVFGLGPASRTTHTPLQQPSLFEDQSD